MEKPDAILCLGDILFGSYDMDPRACAAYLSSLDITILGVKGNCDGYYDDRAVGFSLPAEQFLFFKGHRLVLTHAPVYAGLKKGDIALNGHTHTKTLYEDNGIIHCNPGSIAKPRDGEYGYATIQEEGIFLKNAETFEVIDYLAF